MQRTWTTITPNRRDETHCVRTRILTNFASVQHLPIARLLASITGLYYSLRQVSAPAIPERIYSQAANVYMTNFYCVNGNAKCFYS